MTDEEIIRKEYDEALDKTAERLVNDYELFKHIVRKITNQMSLMFTGIDKLAAFKKKYKAQYDKYCLKYSLLENPEDIQHIQARVQKIEVLNNFNVSNNR